ncbi:MAG: hypothetical protein EKK37_10410 [Sphingobacteriales bacterium]|nr:MAG: hypothetical protein EKK37_10410 [Sphingobacteriales bacterium]
MTRLFLTFVFFLATTFCFGQIEQLEIYKKLYTTADSLNKLGKPFSVDSSIIQKAKSLDKQHPAKYFEELGELFKKAKYHDAAFLYYLGLLRYRYYNSVNPKYQASGDGALAASLQYVAGEPINLFLKTNIDNFISVLKSASDYYSKNDYDFYSRSKDTAKYEEVVQGFSSLIRDLETNRVKYEKEWNDERKMMVENIDKAIDEYNKMTPEEKKKLKDNS